MLPETSSAHRWFRRVLWTALAAALALCGWVGWRGYDERAAIREARAAGWRWESRDPVSLIIKDWRAAWKRETWMFHYRQIVLPDGTDLVSARPLLVRLHPTWLCAERWSNSNLEGLQNFPTLQWLNLDRCTGLQNVDGLQNLPALGMLVLSHCTGLKNVDGLKNLPVLQGLDLSFCSGLQNVNGLNRLSALRGLNLELCRAIPAPALRELRLAFPKADITFPDGTKNPPPP